MAGPLRIILDISRFWLVRARIAFTRGTSSRASISCRTSTIIRAGDFSPRGDLMLHSLVERIREDEIRARVIMARWGEAAAVAVVLLLLAALYIVIVRGG
jgi:hypothetical protein